MENPNTAVTQKLMIESKDAVRRAKTITCGLRTSENGLRILPVST